MGMKTFILVAIVTLFSVSNESCASPLTGVDGGDKQLGETCKACFSINIPEGCGICAEGLDCMPPKDDFGLLIIGADNICVDLEADKKKWQVKLPPLKPPKDLTPKKEEKDGVPVKPCDDITDIKKRLDCELAEGIKANPEVEAKLNKAVANIQSMNLVVCIASIIYLIKLVF